MPSEGDITIVLYHHGTVVPWYHGGIVLWCQGAMALWYDGTMAEGRGGRRGGLWVWPRGAISHVKSMDKYIFRPKISRCARPVTLRGAARRARNIGPGRKFQPAVT